HRFVRRIWNSRRFAGAGKVRRWMQGGDVAAASNLIVYRRDGSGQHANRGGSQPNGQGKKSPPHCFFLLSEVSESQSLFRGGKVLARIAPGGRPYGSRGRPKV